VRKKLAILALAIAAAIPGASLADSNKTCPGGPPGHCKTGGGNRNHSQQQEQNQEQEQRQCLIVIGLLQPANC
jgi:Spy/CpxP family protein refolding chaperone